jgi:hypothetical protein
LHEFETEDDESDEEEVRPRLQVGEDITLDTADIEGDDAASVDTETELEQKATETVSLNL